MNDKSKLNSWILGGGLVIGLGLLGFLLGNAAVKVKSFERSVVVKGLAEREVPADIAIWPTTYQVADNNLDSLFAQIQKNDRVVIDFLLQHGLEETDITVSPPNIIDMFARTYGNNDDIRFRYTGSSSITVYTSNVDAVREATADVIELGKKGIVISGQDYQNMPQFVFNGLIDLKPEMVEDATKSARNVAEKFAEDSQSALGKIKSARQGQFSINDRDSMTSHIKKVRVVSTVEYYLSD